MLECCDLPSSPDAHLGLDDGVQVGAVAVLSLQDRRRLGGQHQAPLVVVQQAARVADVDRGLHLPRRPSDPAWARHKYSSSVHCRPLGDSWVDACGRWMACAVCGHLVAGEDPDLQPGKPQLLYAGRHTLSGAAPTVNTAVKHAATQPGVTGDVCQKKCVHHSGTTSCDLLWSPFPLITRDRS